MEQKEDITKDFINLFLETEWLESLDFANPIVLQVLLTPGG